MIRMRLLPPLAFALAVGVLSATSIDAQPPNAKQQKALARKAALEAQKKAEEQKRAEESRKKAEEQKKEIAKSEKGLEKAATFSPKRIGDTKAVIAAIDAAIERKLTVAKVTPSSPASDAEFLRRVSLDLTGVIPTAAQARKFLESTEPDKREKLVDELLASPNYGQHFADIWLSLLVTRTSDQRRLSFDPLRSWLKDQFNTNRPWNLVVNDLLTATGEQEKNPATTFYLANNTVDKMTDTVSKVFMGVSIQCAQCHNHKFEDWKQTEYWSLAQFFMRVNVGGLQKDGTPSINETKNPNRKKFPLPEDAKSVPARYLRDNTTVTLPENGPVRPQLAKWLTAPHNPYFARSMVNRTWAQLFGAGFVNPIDDMGPNAKPSHPELLESLAGQFATSQFDLKALLKGIVLSQAYQRSGVPAGEKSAEEDKTLFARMTVKVMTPEQLYDSTLQVTGPAGRGELPQRKGPNVKGEQPDAREKFVNFFLAGAEMANATEYDVGIPQALKLINSRQMSNPAAVRKIVNGKTGSAAIEELFLATLSRKPTSAEVKKMMEFIAAAPSKEAGASDVLWALLNCSEFTLIR